MDYIHIGTRKYNPEKSTLVCNTPKGALYQKKRKSQEFFLYNPQGKTSKEKIIPLSWTEANDLVKQYGSREQHIELFTIIGASTVTEVNKSKRVYLDDNHYVKAQRNASRLNLSVRDYIIRLIDKDDANNNWRH